TVLSANGCSAVASTSVGQDNTAPVASLVSSGTLSCAVTSVTLTASAGGQSYRFGGGANQLGSSNQAVVSTSGLYSVTVLSANGCSAVASTSVGQDNTAPVASLVSSGTLSCAVTSVTLTASPDAQSYVFSSGAAQIGNTNQAVVTASGIYSVTVVSANGCSGVAQTAVEADQNRPIVSITPGSATLTCASPTVSLTAMGNGSVRWSTGETTPSILVRAAGTYSVTLTSGNGCAASTHVVIGQDQQVPTASIAANPSLTIAQGQSASLTASASGSTAPVGFRWSTGETTASIAVSVAGPYSLSVTGANGCSATASVVLSLTSAPIMEAPFAITAVTTLNCTPVLPNRYSISFTPRYSGLTGQLVAFRVVNELLPTTEPGPYTIQLYSDNPRIRISAVQTGT
ncbi:hypothetical protein GK091_29290, partial [Spirosoma agri]|nr:hypothetical protein [Spirosoma agri]